MSLEHNAQGSHCILLLASYSDKYLTCNTADGDGDNSGTGADSFYFTILIYYYDILIVGSP